MALHTLWLTAPLKSKSHLNILVFNANDTASLLKLTGILPC